MPCEECLFLQVNGTGSRDGALHSADQPATDKLKSPDRSESSRAKSSRHHSSLSPERCPRHKHSKRHKKEHSHKKSKRSRHEDDASLGDAPAAVAPATDGVEEETEGSKEAVTGNDDLEALRQAALQTTKAAVNAGTDVTMAGEASPEALEDGS